MSMGIEEYAVMCRLDAALDRLEKRYERDNTIAQQLTRDNDAAAQIRVIAHTKLELIKELRTELRRPEGEL